MHEGPLKDRWLKRLLVFCFLLIFIVNFPNYRETYIISRPVVLNLVGVPNPTSFICQFTINPYLGFFKFKTYVYVY